MEFISELITKLRDQIESIEYAVETGAPVTSGDIRTSEHKWHIDKMEQIMRLLDNDELDYESVDKIKEDMEYYVDK